MAQGLLFDSNMLLLVLFWEVYVHVFVLLKTPKPEDEWVFGGTSNDKIPTANEEISFLKSCDIEGWEIVLLSSVK